MSTTKGGNAKQVTQDWTNFVVHPSTAKGFSDVDTPRITNGGSNRQDSPRSTNSTVDPGEAKSDRRLTAKDLKPPGGYVPPQKLGFEKPDEQEVQEYVNGQSSLLNGDEATSSRGSRGSQDSSPPMSLVEQPQPQKRSKVHTFLMAPSTHHLTMRNYESYLKAASSEYTTLIHPNKRHKPNTSSQSQEENPHLPKGWINPAEDSKTSDLDPNPNPTQLNDTEPTQESENTEDSKPTDTQESPEKTEETLTQPEEPTNDEVDNRNQDIDTKTDEPTQQNNEPTQEVEPKPKPYLDEPKPKPTTQIETKSEDTPQTNGDLTEKKEHKPNTKNWKKPKPVFLGDAPFDLPSDPDAEPDEVWPKPEIELTKEEIEEIGELNGQATTLMYYKIDTYFDAESRIRYAQKIKQENEYHGRIELHLRRLRDQEECRRKLKRRRPPSNISLDGLVKDSLRSQVHLQEFKCWNCNKTLRIRGGGARYCEYTGKCYCQRCHFGESAHIPAKIVQDLDVERYLICRASKSELDHIHEKPIIPRSLINSKIYFSNKTMQRLSIVQLQLTIMCNFIETCSQKASLRKVLGTRSYFLYEDDLISIRDMVAFLNSNLVDRLEVAVKTFEKHITRECAQCCVKGYFCEYCKDPQPIFTFQIPAVLQCEACGGCFHTVCYEPDNCPKCIRQQQRARA